jgi:predicted glutamine amidotransferase
MCRIFAQISPAPTSASHFLVDADYSLFKQSNFNPSNLQADGWGIGWFDADGRPKVEKAPKAAYSCVSRFESAARSAVSRVVIGHLRAASNPRRLPRAKLLTMGCTQPFTDGEWLFSHNGTIQIPLEIADRLGPWRKKLKSDNDSEVYFWQFRKFFDQLRDGPAAFEACVKELWSVWDSCRAKHPAQKTPYTSLNAVISDGQRLFAFCHGAATGLANEAICTPGQPWQTMSFSERSGSLIVSSENMDKGTWTRFATPEILSVHVDGGKLRVEKIRYEFGGRALVRKRSAEAAL